jgi:hypothetical protein
LALVRAAFPLKMLTRGWVAIVAIGVEIAAGTLEAAAAWGT